MARTLAKIDRKYYKHDFKVLIAYEMERLAVLQQQKEITPELQVQIDTVTSLVRQFRLCERKMLNYLWCQKAMDKALEIKAKIDEFWEEDALADFEESVHEALNQVVAKEDEVMGALWIKVDKENGNSFTDKAKEENPELADRMPPSEPEEELPPAPEPQGKTYRVIFEPGEQATFEGDVQPWSKKEKKVGEGITLEDLPVFPNVKVTDGAHYQVSTDTPWTTRSDNMKNLDCTEEEIRQMNIKSDLYIIPHVVGK